MKKRGIYIFIFSFLLIYLAGIFFFEWKELSFDNYNFKQEKTWENIQKENYFVVIPHHNITYKTIDLFYQSIQKKYNTIKNIVIISPNHYAKWEDFYASFQEKWSYCFVKNGDDIQNKNCIHWTPFSFYKEEKTSNSFIHYDEKVDGAFLLEEHGIWEHFQFINTYFPEYKNLYALSLKWEWNDWFQKTEKIFETLKDYDFWPWNTLFIASVDFSHHVFEQVAFFHDLASVEELNKNIFKTAEVDSPESLFLLKSLAKKSGKETFKLFDRTSSSSIFEKNLWYENTSHIFGEFLMTSQEEKNQIIAENMAFFDDHFFIEKNENKETSSWAIYGMFFWDTHLTRSFDYEKAISFIPSSKQDKKEYFSCFYQNWDITKNPFFWKNRMFYGFDFIWINFETAMCEKEYIIDSTKEVRFLTNPDYIHYFKEIWINLFNLSNNHSYDYDDKCFSRTKEILSENNLFYFWEGRKDESNILKLEKDDLKLAFIWFDTITLSSKIEIVKENIKILKKEGYRVILNIHWGIEYKKENTQWQKTLAYSFIDAWVDMIIWHHPHSIENYEVYKWVPIFYSLWNFIFDQGFDETLTWMWVVYRIDENSLRYSPIYFERNKNDFTLNCESFY